jgi:WD40 repeat protein
LLPKGGKSDVGEVKGKVASYEDPCLGNITNIQWSPHDARYFASAGDDGAVSIWDSHTTHALHNTSDTSNRSNESLLFRHSGHRASIVDFDWNSSSPWTIVSMSDDSQNPRLGGGTMQVWRITDLLYKNDVVAEKNYVSLLDKGKDHLNSEGGSSGSNGIDDGETGQSNKRSKH